MYTNIPLWHVYCDHVDLYHKITTLNLKFKEYDLTGKTFREVTTTNIGGKNVDVQYFNNIYSTAL